MNKNHTCTCNVGCVRACVRAPPPVQSRSYTRTRARAHQKACADIALLVARASINGPAKQQRASPGREGAAGRASLDVLASGVLQDALRGSGSFGTMRASDQTQTVLVHEALDGKHVTVFDALEAWNKGHLNVHRSKDATIVY